MSIQRLIRLRCDTCKAESQSFDEATCTAWVMARELRERGWSLDPDKLADGEPTPVLCATCKRLAPEPLPTSLSDPYSDLT